MATAVESTPPSMDPCATAAEGATRRLSPPLSSLPSSPASLGSTSSETATRATAAPTPAPRSLLPQPPTAQLRRLPSPIPISQCRRPESSSCSTVPIASSWRITMLDPPSHPSCRVSPDSSASRCGRSTSTADKESPPSEQNPRTSPCWNSTQPTRPTNLHHSSASAPSSVERVSLRTTTPRSPPQKAPASTLNRSHLVVPATWTIPRMTPPSQSASSTLAPTRWRSRKSMASTESRHPSSTSSCPRRTSDPSSVAQRSKTSEARRWNCPSLMVSPRSNQPADRWRACSRAWAALWKVGSEFTRSTPSR
mmetsp:Transcript_24534/g.68380  ORF Transcript_24534/g.68380 Transcript_24534/m.68380 type:complete len:309 (-) Transcript_24534:159-1085(-)